MRMTAPPEQPATGLLGSECLAFSRATAAEKQPCRTGAVRGEREWMGVEQGEHGLGVDGIGSEWTGVERSGRGVDSSLGWTGVEWTGAGQSGRE